MIMGPTHEGHDGDHGGRCIKYHYFQKRASIQIMNPQDRNLPYDEQISDERLKFHVSSLSGSDVNTFGFFQRN